MASKTQTEPAPDVGRENPDTPEAPIPGTVRLINRDYHPRDLTLTDGSNVRLGPWGPFGGSNESGWIPKKLVPPAVLRMVQRGLLRMEEAGK